MTRQESTFMLAQVDEPLHTIDDKHRQATKVMIETVEQCALNLFDADAVAGSLLMSYVHLIAMHGGDPAASADHLRHLADNFEQMVADLRLGNQQAASAAKN